MTDIKKAIIPTAGLGTRFLPLSKVVPKELWPLVDRPVIQHIIEEAKNSGITEIIFVMSPGNKKLQEYLSKNEKLEAVLKEKRKDTLLAELKQIEELTNGLKFEYVYQKEPLGDGHAILQAGKKIKDEPVAVLFGDDIVYSEKPCLSQLITTFRTCQKPIIALYRLPKEKLRYYGIVGVDKIANRFFKLKKIIEKPDPGKEPSDLAIVGKYVLIPEVFHYLKKAKPGFKGEIIIAEVFSKMLDDGRLIYGYEFEGKWLECGNKFEWLKSNAYLSLSHPKYGPEIRRFLREGRLI